MTIDTVFFIAIMVVMAIELILVHKAVKAALQSLKKEIKNIKGDN